MHAKHYRLKFLDDNLKTIWPMNFKFGTHYAFSRRKAFDFVGFQGHLGQNGHLTKTVSVGHLHLLNASKVEFLLTTEYFTAECTIKALMTHGKNVGHFCHASEWCKCPTFIHVSFTSQQCTVRPWSAGKHGKHAVCS